jgi:hypothetical protein
MVRVATYVGREHTSRSPSVRQPKTDQRILCQAKAESCRFTSRSLAALSARAHVSPLRHARDTRKTSINNRDLQHAASRVQHTIMATGCVSRYVTPEQLANSRNLQHALSAASNRGSLNRCPTPRPSDTSRPRALLLRWPFLRAEALRGHQARMLDDHLACARACGIGHRRSTHGACIGWAELGYSARCPWFWTLVAVHSNGRSQLRCGRSALRQLMGTRLSPRLCAARDHSHVRAKQCTADSAVGLILLRDALTAPPRSRSHCAAACIHECR